MSPSLCTDTWCVRVSAHSTVLFVSVCKVTISDYYEPLSFNGITGEKIYRQKITFEHVKTYCSNSQHDYLGCVS